MPSSKRDTKLFNFHSVATLKGGLGYKSKIAFAIIISTQRCFSAPYRRVDAVKHYACRDRRPRRSKKEKILNLHPAIIGSHIKSKICCFPDRRGRRSLQGLRGIGRKGIATKLTVTSILDRRGDGDSLESPVYENQIFCRRTTNGRPYGQKNNQR